MFTQGQWIFTGFFVVAFICAITYSYRKDIKLHKKYYKGSLLILGGFILFIGILFVIKTFLR
ncbi:hypothetical protein SAMN04488096_101408 [Mesonia phycicola]|uniref:Uncharacterized protein n=1 Tax=Mesonia phycicola TaxID=579105 RepID=A0A1M6ARH2_9FLAO|nr:hypothetical protein [Mesonia phycicola]SHI39055.1 hypothetical protein SAMN04488096_101408 [Mesonia phycicola]